MLPTASFVLSPQDSIASRQYRPPKKNWTSREASDRITALTESLAFESHARAELLHQRAKLQISRQEWSADLARAGY